MPNMSHSVVAIVLATIYTTSFKNVRIKVSCSYW